MLAVLQATPDPLPSGYGLALLQAVVALVAVCLTAWVTLRWASKLRWGKSMRGGRIHMLQRFPLDARRSLYIVRVDDQTLLLGVGDAGAPRVLQTLNTVSDAVDMIERPKDAPDGE
ncbi:MAG: flagellar biosynthetic protein FliO [Polyangiales bacterium]